MSAVYANSSNQIAALKELYTDDKDYMKDLVYKENPFLALVPKNESPDGFAGKYYQCLWNTPIHKDEATAFLMLKISKQQQAFRLFSYTSFQIISW